MGDSLLPVEVCASIYALSDVGNCRPINEDAFVIGELRVDDEATGHLEGEVRSRNGLVLGVFDGCGGMSSGEVASATAAEVVLSSLRSRDTGVLGPDLERAVRNANRKVCQLSDSSLEHRGMGTTATTAALIDDRLEVAHVGDSRAYLLRADRLVQVSRDQTLLHSLIEAGQILPEEIESFPLKNVILQALGTGPVLDVDRTSVSLRQGDILLLCSDGLTDLGDDEIKRLCEGRDLESACHSLVDAANAAGGFDNITVVLARFHGDWLRPPSPEETLESRNAVSPPEDATSWHEAGGGIDGPPPSSETPPSVMGMADHLRRLVGRLRSSATHAAADFVDSVVHNAEELLERARATEDRQEDRPKKDNDKDS